jgi:3-hydroxybenzoate 6-monooxygenase
MSSASLPILVAGGGIGGVAAALALVRQGFDVKVLEQAPQLGEIGAGIQLGPNGFAAFDALGIGERARARAVYTDEMVMHDAVDESLVGRIPTGEAFRKRFGNPYAVIHRADVHKSLLEGAEATGRIEVATSTTVAAVEQDAAGATVIDAKGQRHRGAALIGADGVKSAVRAQLVGDAARVSGHVVYRAVVEKKDFPADLQWNAASIWVGPNCHLVHYPLRGGEQYNVVVTFHSRDQEAWSVRRQPRRGAELLRRHLRTRTAVDRVAQRLEALGHGRPRADRAMELRSCHAARRRRAPDAAIPGARRLHGDGRRSDAGRSAARA